MDSKDFGAILDGMIAKQCAQDVLIQLLLVDAWERTPDPFKAAQEFSDYIDEKESRPPPQGIPENLAMAVGHHIQTLVAGAAAKLHSRHR